MVRISHRLGKRRTELVEVKRVVSIRPSKSIRDYSTTDFTVNTQSLFDSAGSPKSQNPHQVRHSPTLVPFTLISLRSETNVVWAMLTQTTFNF